ncbi:MAG: LssY C-terminal domain-containing protein [Xanthomonadales bacterium]|jgi:hypothetical protein|nr:LssY C-terminal domain-containing protein [Xanthomonadales bacterium]
MIGKITSGGIRTAVSALAMLLLASCAAGPEPVAPLPEGDFRERLVVQERDGIRVTAGVPSARETEALFREKLYKQGIQPVWLRIENRRDEIVSFLPVGLDPQYYSPLEVANLEAARSTEPEELLDPFFLEQRMRLYIEPGSSTSGYVFSSLDEGTKSFNVDIVGESHFDTFTFFIPVPGLRIDHYDVDWRNLYPEDAWQEVTEEQLLAGIEAFQCCVTNASGDETGDPLNLVLIGFPGEVYTAFIRAGWDETEAITGSTTWKTVKSFFSGENYRYSPVSSLYALGRPQDVAFQWTRQNIHERNHLRLWMSRFTYEGKPVWVGQISRDIGVRFTRKTITTHKIDPQVDETRDYLLENLAYAQSLKAFAYAGGVGAVPQDAPRGNLTGDPWFTDGLRLVLWISAEPTAIDDLQFIDWRRRRGD